MIEQPLDWERIKKGKKGFLTARKVEVTFDPRMGKDSLLPLKEVYSSYKTTTRQDGGSEDVVIAIVPGVNNDNPVNDALVAAHASLKALTPKHVGPKIGNIDVKPSELMDNLAASKGGCFKRKFEDHLLFTYHLAPVEFQRKRMRYLSGGDTFWNTWPCPMVAISQMPRVTTDQHDKIFAGCVPMESGDDTAPMEPESQTLGDNVIPFPHEHSKMLTKEIINVFSVRVLVALNAGAGESMKAVLEESIRGVAIARNKAHKDFVFGLLSMFVKEQRLHQAQLPPKPMELTRWESSRGAPPPHLLIQSNPGIVTPPPPPPPKLPGAGLAGFGAGTLGG